MTKISLSQFASRRPRATIAIKLAIALIIVAVINYAFISREAFIDLSDEVIHLPVDERSSVFLGPYAKSLKETDGALTLEEVQTREDWAPVGLPYMSFGGIKKPIWIRSRIKNTTDYPINVRFDTRRVAFDYLNIWLVDPSTKEANQVLQYDFNDPFSERPVQHRMLVVDVVFGAGEEKEAFIRYSGIYNSVLPIRVASPEAFEKADKHEIFWSAQFYGLFSAMIFLTVLTSPLIGWRLGLSFSAFLVTGILTVLSTEGYIDQFVAPALPGFGARLTDSIYLLHYTSILFLSRYVFNLRERFRLLDKLIVYSIILAVPLTLFHFFIGINERTIFVPLVLFLRAICLVLHSSVGIWALLNRQPGATAFAIGSLLITVSAVHMLVDETFGYPYGGIPFIVRLLITVEAAAFAAAIVRSVVQIKRERDRAVEADLAATREKLRLSTELQKSQKAYEQARGQAGHYLERLRSVGHDILQPLSSLRGTFQALPKQSAGEEKSIADAFNYLEALARDGVHAEARAHGAKSEEEEISVEKLLTSVAAMFKEEAEAKGIRLSVDSNAPGRTVEDPVTLMRAVSNLVANSIRYTDEGSVTISSSSDTDAVIISVSDTGRGMSSDELARYKTRNEKSGGSSGSGLGLAIVQEAAETMAAQLSFNSQPGRGTSVTLRLAS